MSQKKVKINLDAVGSITGKINIDLDNEEKDMLVEFVRELDRANMIKGSDTSAKMSRLITYLDNKKGVKQCVLDAETVHMIWLHMRSMAGRIEKETAEMYCLVMDKIAGCLDEIVEKIVKDM